MTDKNYTGAEILLKVLKEHDVDTVFGYPGGAVLPLYDALYDDSIHHILTRHEQGAVHAAEGYAKATGKPGVVIVTSGPGATNAVTGIADAMSDSVPLIVFTGQVATSGIGKDAFQEADIVGITMPITKNNYQVRYPEDLPKIIDEAFHIATTGRKGPVVIDLPKDLTVSRIQYTARQPVHLASYQPTYQPNKLQIHRLIEALKQSKKPAVLAGGGIHYADAVPEFRQFIEKYRIPTLSTLLGLGALPTDHELFLGMGGMHGTFAANMALTDCDLLINFGARFDDRLASAPQSFAPNAIIAHVDIDPAEIGKVVKTQLPIVGDAKAALQALLAEDAAVSCSKWQELNQLRKKRHPFHYQPSEEEIKPQAIIEEIGRITDGEAIVVTDVGQHQMWAAQFYPFKNTNQLITSGGLGTMGFGIPAAIGAQLAHPDKTVVLFVGDGGFQMTSQELAILNDYQLPIKIILLNNGSLGMVRQWQERFFNGRKSESVFHSQPDFIKLAEAYGVQAKKYEQPNQLADFADFFQKQAPVLMEVLIPGTEEVLPMVPAGKPNDQMLGVD